MFVMINAKVNILAQVFIHSPISLALISLTDLFSSIRIFKV